MAALAEMVKQHYQEQNSWGKFLKQKNPGISGGLGSGNQRLLEGKILLKVANTISGMCCLFLGLSPTDMELFLEVANEIASYTREVSSKTSEMGIMI